MRRTDKHRKKKNLDWLDSFFTYINGNGSKKYKHGSKKHGNKKNGYVGNSYLSENARENGADEIENTQIVKPSLSERSSSVEPRKKKKVSSAGKPDFSASGRVSEKKPVSTNGESEKSKTDERPLWEKNPSKYRKKRSFFIRLLGGLWSFAFFWILTAGIIGTVILGAGMAVLYSFSDPELDERLASLEISSTSQILAYNSQGELVVYEELHSTENRVWVSINEMPQHLLDILVAMEDKRFYQHKGFDPIRTVSATVQYAVHKLSGGSGVGSGGGGSTITQQVIKNITLDDDTEGWGGIVRKFKEILRAFYIERKYNKDQILEYYLNTVYFGNGCYGMYTAANYYFGKEVSELSMTECAAILSITNDPSYYDPYLKPDNNYDRRTLALWYAKDQGKISQEEYQSAIAEPLILRDRSSSGSSSSGNSVFSYFTDLVFEWTVNELMEQKGYTRSYAESYIYTSGLRIYTTVDPDIQSIMEDYFSDENNYIDKDSEIKAEVSMEVIDPTTGNILGVIGGRGVKTQSLLLNRVTQTKRPPGSAIKPISIYGYAIENNIITAATAIDDSPLYVEAKQNKVSEEEYGVSGITYTSYTSWPVNYDRKYNGILDAKTALYNSYNTPAVKVLQMIGVEESYNFAKNMMRLDSLVPQDKDLAPLSVGSLTYGVTLQELTAAYTVYANQGSYAAPRCVTRIETFDGKVVLENDVDKSIVFTPQTAYIMTDILQKAVSNGSSSDVANLAPIATAGKSGTTSNFQDRWFIGYTPYYLAGIWWGYDIPQSNENTHHVQMWHDVMQQIHSVKGISEGEFTQPDGIVTATYCNCSGKAPGLYCSSDPRGSRVRTGLFKSGTQPTETCDVHHQLYVCSESGQIAHENCPSVYLQTFIDIARSYENAYIRIRDAEYVCPPLSNDQVLYNSSELPVYTYMIPEGEYPCLPQSVKSSYANCLCQLHAAPETAYPYMHKFTTDGSSSSGEDVQTPEDLLTPDELDRKNEQEQFVEVAIQVYDQKKEILEGLDSDGFVELAKHVYDTDGSIISGITTSQYLELAKYVYDTKKIVLDGLSSETYIELAKYVYEKYKTLLDGVSLETVAPSSSDINSGASIFDIPDLPIIFQ